MRKFALIASLCFLSFGSIAGTTASAPSGASGGGHAGGGAASSHASAGAGSQSIKEVGGATFVSVSPGVVNGKPARITMLKSTEPVSATDKERLRRHGWHEDLDRESGITYYCSWREVGPGKLRNCFGVTKDIKASPAAT